MHISVHDLRVSTCRFALVAAIACAGGDAVAARNDQASGVFGDNGAAARADVMTPRGAVRRINFEATEGTDTSIDVSPDGTWILFDLLGHIYRMPAAGGTAECLTQGSGVALNLHPRYSQDGKQIAFVSDRSGQLNVWVMQADGSKPRIVFADLQTRFYDPSWAPDGNSIVAVRGSPTPGRAWHRRNASIWQLPLAGGTPQPILAGTLQQYYAPQFSRNGTYLYFHTSKMAYRGYSIAQNGFHLQRRDMRSGKIEELPGRDPNWQPEQEDSDNKWLANFGDVTSKEPAEFEPRLSPDGRLLAYGRAAPNSDMTYRGHVYRPATELVVRDLQTGTERVVAPRITKDLHNMHAIYAEVHLPNFGWTPDSKAIVISIDGKIRRVAVDDGGVSEIPFRARVDRVISEQVRGRQTIDDATVHVRYLQQPASSADGKRRAFAAAGQVWITGADGTRPAAVTLPTGPTFQATPRWSPDGTQLALVSWDNATRGQVWLYTPATGTARQLTLAAGEYLYPVWSADGRSLFYVARADAPIKDARDAPWSVSGDWRILRADVATGNTTELTKLPQLRPIARMQGDRIQFTAQADPKAARDLSGPYPNEESQEQDFALLSIGADGGAPTTHLKFPARLPAKANDPILSPDGTRVVYHADHQIFLERVADAARATDAHGFVDTNPNRARPTRTRLDVRGGVDPSWIDDNTIEFAAGDTIVRYDVASGRRSETRIRLDLPRAVPTGTIALKGATLITLEPGRPDAIRGDVVVAGARIKCAGTCDLKGVDKVIEATGKFIMPGLIDVHSHILEEPTPVIPLYRPGSAISLAYGVTTAIDPAVSSSALFPIGDMTETGLILGPRSLGTAEIVYDSEATDGSMSTSMGDIKTIRNADDAAYQVERRAAWGAVSIKNFRQNRREQHQLLLDAARKANVSVTGEGGAATFDVSLIMDGQTGWEHLIPSLPLRSDLTRFLGLAHATYSPTAIIAGHLAGTSAYFRPRANLAADPRHRRFYSPTAIAEQDARTPALRAKEEFSFPLIAEGLADIVRAGGYGALGEHGEQPGLGTHWELWAYAEALHPIEALRVGTIDAARFVGLEKELGTIRAGKVADLVVLNSNPLANIRNSTDTAWVMKAGSLFEAATLRPVWTADRVRTLLERGRSVSEGTAR